MNAPVVLVTGAARRIGAQIAQTLHGAGARLVLHYRSSQQDAEQLAAQLNAQRSGCAITVQTDLNCIEALPALVDTALAEYGRLDALVNNASSFFATPLGQITPAQWDDLMNSNLKAPLFLSQAAAPALRDQGGCIVNITDIHAQRPMKDYPVYCAAKAGLLGATRALAIELAPRVRVNAVAPGAIAWPQTGRDFLPQDKQAIIEHTLLKRVGHPEDIARAVKYLIFDAPYVTGQVIQVDGGRTAHL
jgi:pteridine reductase